MMEEQQYAYCSGQCQASRFPPVSCRCICGGRNHGILRHSPINVTPYRQGSHDERFNAWMDRFEEPKQIEPLKQLPHIQPTIQIVKPRDTRPFSIRHTLTSRVARSLKTAVSGYSQDDLNLMVLNGLRKQFSQERTDNFVTEAFSEYFSHQPDANTPELYELYENGDLDRVLDRRSIRWVIGRPKLKR